MQMWAVHFISFAHHAGTVLNHHQPTSQHGSFASVTSAHTCYICCESHVRLQVEAAAQRAPPFQAERQHQACAAAISQLSEAQHVVMLAQTEVRCRVVLAMVDCSGDAVSADKWCAVRVLCAHSVCSAYTLHMSKAIEREPAFSTTVTSYYLL